MISILHPSRGRPEQAFKTAKRWIESAGVPVEYILSIDGDDISDYDTSLDIFVRGRNKSVVEATNRAAMVASGNILVYISDDVEPCDNWANIIEDICYPLFKTEEHGLVLKVDDGHQPFKNDIITFPIMSKLLYHNLGYFWNPIYKSMYCDRDLYHVCSRMGVIKFHPEIKFVHNHPDNGRAEMDETYQRSFDNQAEGFKIFERRMKTHFRK